MIGNKVELNPEQFAKRVDRRNDPIIRPLGTRFAKINNSLARCFGAISLGLRQKVHTTEEDTVRVLVHRTVRKVRCLRQAHGAG